MKNSSQSRTQVISLALTGAAVLLIGFQNCAPMLPLDGVVSAASGSVRATATPGSTPPVAGSGGGYTGSSYDGVCITDPASDLMAVNGADLPGAALVAFKQADGRTALWNIGNGSISKGVVCQLSGYSLQAIGDFNGDSNPDILWRNSAGDVVLWLMRGATRIQTGYLSISSTTSQIEGIGDFDKDGKKDLIWRDSNTGKVTLWYMNGLSGKTDGTAFSLPARAQIIGESDYSKNAGAAGVERGILSQTGGVLHLTTVTSSTSSSSVDFGASIYSGYSVMGAGDFSGDLSSDLFVRRASDSAMMMRYMSGGALLSDSTAYAATDSNWTFQFAQDLTGDGRADWVWTNQGASQLLLGITPVAVTPGSTSFLPTPIQPGFTLFKYPHIIGVNAN